MNKYRKIILVFLLFNSAFMIHSQSSETYLESNAALANKRTALRCLSLADNYFAEKNYSAALAQTNLGLAYCQDLSDLWYMLACVQNLTGSAKAEVLSSAEKALSLNNWNEYKRDSARILYADLLCDTLRFDEVFDVLDSKPMIYSSDAEFIRAKAYYRKGDSESIEKAREKIDVARRIYTRDERFPLLFFKYENPLEKSETVEKISSFFVNEIIQSADTENKNAELEIYASLFADDETCVRLLKSFSARNLSHPLYAVMALKKGLISEKESFEYLAKFADDSINLNYINAELELLSENEIFSLAAEYFNSYSGVIEQDTDGDGICNLYVKYSRGRPETLFYDKNQDGEVDWNLTCDFGAGVNGTIYLNRNFADGENQKEKVSLAWKNYPSLESVKFSDERYYFVSKSLEFSLVNFSAKNEISKILDFDFFYPELIQTEDLLSKKNLLSKCSYFEFDSKKNPGTTIRFVLDNGNLRTAVYFFNHQIFAQCQFENNFPSLRVVDSDRDGIYETSEFYAAEKNNSFTDYAMEEEKKIIEETLKVSFDDLHFYLKLVQSDLNKDSVPDFTEEYLEYGGKISSWDTDGDSNWNVRYIKYPQKKDSDGFEEILKEESLFYIDGKKLVSVKSEDSLPVSVNVDGKNYSVRKDSSSDFYWIGDFDKNFSDEYYTNLAQNALFELQNAGEAKSLILAAENFSLLCIKVSGKNYGFIIPTLEFEENSNQVDGEQND